MAPMLTGTITLHGMEVGRMEIGFVVSSLVMTTVCAGLTFWIRGTDMLGMRRDDEQR